MPLRHAYRFLHACIQDAGAPVTGRGRRTCATSERGRYGGRWHFFHRISRELISRPSQVAVAMPEPRIASPPDAAWSPRSLRAGRCQVGKAGAYDEIECADVRVREQSISCGRRAKSADLARIWS